MCVSHFQEKEISVEITIPVLNIGDFKQHGGELAYFCFGLADTVKIPTMIERKFSKCPTPINWNKRVRDERQRAPDEFFTACFHFFCCFFSPFLTGWQVELGAKDVQGSEKLSKCLLNNAEFPRGVRGG